MSGVLDSCATAGDCPPSEECVCRAGVAKDDPGSQRVLSLANECVPADCRTDSDCGGDRCDISLDVCWVADGLHCHGPADECRDPDDCPGPLARCHYDADKARWRCGGFAICD